MILKSIIVWGSIIIRFFIGFAVTAYAVGEIPFLHNLSVGWQVLLLFLGASTILTLLHELAKRMRLVCFSINYFVDSILFFFVAALLHKSISFSFFVYALVQFIFARVSWCLARRADSFQEVGYSVSFWGSITVYLQHILIDEWENSSTSWNNLYIQIIISLFFYFIGSFTIGFYFPDVPHVRGMLYVIAATVVNFLFDLKAFRKIDAMLD